MCEEDIPQFRVIIQTKINVVLKEAYIHKKYQKAKNSSLSSKCSVVLIIYSQWIMKDDIFCHQSLISRIANTNKKTERFQISRLVEEERILSRHSPMEKSSRPVSWDTSRPSLRRKKTNKNSRPFKHLMSNIFIKIQLQPEQLDSLWIQVLCVSDRETGGVDQPREQF